MTRLQNRNKLLLIFSRVNAKLRKGIEDKIAFPYSRTGKLGIFTIMDYAGIGTHRVALRNDYDTMYY